MIRMFQIGLLLASAILLNGCAKESSEELAAWVAQQKAAPRPNLIKTQQPFKFVPAVYELGYVIDPFSPKKLAGALKSEKQSAGSLLITKELERRKEPLEQYPRESFVFSGSMMKNGQPIGLVKVGAQLFYVKVGDYLGLNFGRVVRVTDSELGLREIIQNGSGDWVEQMATMKLQENSQ